MADRCWRQPIPAIPIVCIVVICDIAVEIAKSVTFSVRAYADTLFTLGTLEFHNVAIYGHAGLQEVLSGAGCECVGAVAGCIGTVNLVGQLRLPRCLLGGWVGFGRPRKMWILGDAKTDEGEQR